MPPPFIPGVELARLFYAEVVGPLLETECPGLAYSAALIGWGSEVLGFDSPRSTDHNWGPRLQVFLADDAVGTHTGRVAELLAGRLPAEFRGYPTVFATSGARAESAGHWVAVAGLRSWLAGTLGFDPLAGISQLDWLSVPTQVLAEVTGGAVFHDGLALGAGSGTLAASGGALTAVRAALAWYPRDIWLYILACQWQRLTRRQAGGSGPGRASSRPRPGSPRPAPSARLRRRRSAEVRAAQRRPARPRRTAGHAE